MKKAEQTAQTKQALVRSLIAVGRKKTLAKVSVADLTRASGISRGTFYLHYLDKDDLVAKTEAALLKELTDCLDFGMDTSMEPSTLATGQRSPLMVNMVHLINQQRDLCQFLLSPAGDPSFLGRIAKLLRDKILGHLAELKGEAHFIHDIPDPYVSQIIVYGIIDIIQLWLNETNPRSEAEIVDILMKTRFLSPYQLLALEK